MVTLIIRVGDILVKYIMFTSLKIELSFYVDTITLFIRLTTLTSSVQECRSRCV